MNKKDDSAIIRERKGSFFTPQNWVELSQKYIADALGDDWQNNYYVWDCCAGTGNLLVGINRKPENVFASTIDESDVKAMYDRIDNGARLLKRNVFQFDFLNDDFKKLPKKLKDIIDDPEKRKKLVIYINPPYAEGDSKIGSGRKGIQISKIQSQYKNQLGKASSEIFAQFFVRIYSEIPNCILANFSKIKIIQAPNFTFFRQYFKPKLIKLFIMPAETFDNVNGKFPIGFFIWDFKIKSIFKKIKADIFGQNGKLICKKEIISYDKVKYISEWLEVYSDNISNKYIGHLASVGNDFQHQRDVYIDDVNRQKIKGGRHTMITVENLVVSSIYFSVRHCIKADWLNDRDQFLFPNDDWEKDTEFQNNCLTYTLFNNNIQSKYGINYWIPFNEEEVNARGIFKSHFMTKFINGKFINNGNGDLFLNISIRKKPLKFSKEAKDVFEAGKLLFKYYHSIPRVNVDASLYDIKLYFQGAKDGRMNNKSNDEEYNRLISNLREKMKILAAVIEPKVYEYGFLFR